MIELERDAPDLEDLAAYLDGRLSEERRSAVEARLLRDEDYYEVYLETVQFLEQERDAPLATEGGGEVVTPAAWRRSLRYMAPIAVAATVVAVLGVWRWMVGPPVEEWITQLDATKIVNQEEWDDPRWRRTRSGNPQPNRLTPEQLAFRVGTHTVALRIALAAGDPQAAIGPIGQLDNLLADSETLFPFSSDYGDLLSRIEDGDMDRLTADAARLEASLKEFLEGSEAQRYALGQWNEAGRLAALAGDADVLADVFRNRREALNIMGIEQHLGDLEAIVESEPGEQAFQAAEQAFSEIAHALAGLY